MKKVPILLLIFKRPDNILKAIEPVRAYKPTRLYIGADGPRHGREDEIEQCEQTRKAVLDAIDWDCKVITLFRDENLGCANAVNGAISWFFEQEEYGVIIEEDCVLKLDFLNFCEELLPLYKKEDKVMQICAHNPAGSSVISNDYYFGRNAYIWGWATWASSWNKMDMNMSAWPSVSFVRLVKEYGVFQASFRNYYWNKSYKNLTSLSSWATRWNLSVLVNNGLCISPKANMCKNIGVDADGGTHYYKGYSDPYKHLMFGEILKPLQHPSVIALTKDKIKEDKMEFNRLRWLGFKNKLKKIK